MRKFLAIAGMLAVSTVSLLAAITIGSAGTSGGFGAATGSTNNSASYTTSDTPSFTVGNLAICMVVSSDVAGGDDANSPSSVTSSSNTWTNVGTSVTFASSTPNSYNIAAFRSVIASSTGEAITATFPDAQTGVLFMCAEFAGTETGGTNGSSAILQAATDAVNAGSVTTLTPTFGSARTSNSAVFNCGATSALTNWTLELTTAIADASYSSPTAEARCQYVVGGSDTTPQFTVSGTPTGGGSLAIEIAIAGGGGGGGSAPKGFLTRGIGNVN